MSFRERPSIKSFDHEAFNATFRLLRSNINMNLFIKEIESSSSDEILKVVKKTLAKLAKMPS